MNFPGSTDKPRHFGKPPPWLPEDGAKIERFGAFLQETAQHNVQRNEETLDIVVVGTPRLWHQSRKSLEFLGAVADETDSTSAPWLDSSKHPSNMRIREWAIDSENPDPDSTSDILSEYIKPKHLLVGSTCLFMKHRGKHLSFGDREILMGPFNKQQITACIEAGVSVCDAVLAAGNTLPVNWYERPEYSVKFPANSGIELENQVQMLPPGDDEEILLV